MFDPQLWFGVALTLAVVLLGYMAWDSMKNYVEGYVRRELLDHTRRQLAARTALKDTFSNADQSNN